MTGSSHVDVAAYVLGALNDEDNLAFERHLLDCSSCQLELLEMHDLPELLDEIKRTWPAPPMPAPSPRVLNALLEEASRVRRKRRKTGRLAVAAGVLVAATGSVLTLTLFANSDTGGDTPQALATQQAEVRSATAPNQTGNAALLGKMAEDGIVINAKIALAPREYGAEAELELTGIAGPLNCRLLVVSRSGASQVVTSWTVPEKGFGLPDSPAPLRVSGSTGLTPAEIARFEIRADDGTLLVTVPH